jgi:DNA-directed RNA polymerase specialized sigma24 family protein
MTKQNWTDERTAQLVDAVAGLTVVTQDKLAELADLLETTSRSVGSKLRSLTKDGTLILEVQKASDIARVTWPEADEAELKAFLEANAGVFTYSEVAASFQGGKFTTRQLQGKILSLELTDAVKKAEKAAPVRSYTEEEEALYVAKAAEGASLEEIAEVLGKSIQSIRGKGLSLMRENRIVKIPSQTVSQAKAVKADPFEGLDISEMTAEEVAKEIGSSVRGVKNTLTRRGVSCKNHDGAAKRIKLDNKEAEAEATA